MQAGRPRPERSAHHEAGKRQEGPCAHLCPQVTDLLPPCVPQSDVRILPVPWPEAPATRCYREQSHLCVGSDGPVLLLSVMAEPVGRLQAVPASLRLLARRTQNLSSGFGQNPLLPVQVHTAAPIPAGAERSGARIDRVCGSVGSRRARGHVSTWGTPTPGSSSSGGRGGPGVAVKVLTTEVGAPASARWAGGGGQEADWPGWQEGCSPLLRGTRSTEPSGRGAQGASWGRVQRQGWAWHC